MQENIRLFMNVHISHIMREKGHLSLDSWRRGILLNETCLNAVFCLIHVRLDYFSSRQRSDTVCGNSRMLRLWIVINSNVANAIKCNMRSLDNYLFKDENSCTNKTMSSIYFRTLDTYLIHYHNLVYIPRYVSD